MQVGSIEQQWMVDPDNRHQLWAQSAESSAQARRAKQEEVRLPAEFQRRAYAA